MSAWPVIIRELGAEARRPLNYRYRVFAAAVVLGLLGMYCLGGNIQEGNGGELFAIIIATLWVCIWIFVPVLSADCISREKREGALGLLFLTPLTSTGIVIGKALVHAIRGFTFLIAVIPMMAVSFLMGGLGWRAVVVGSVINFSALALALSAGILASSYCQRWGRVMVATLIGAVVVLAVHAAVTSRIVSMAFFNDPSVSRHSMIDLYILYGTGIGMTTGNDILSNCPPQLWSKLQMVIGGELVSAFGILALTVVIASRRLQRSWQYKTPTRREIWLHGALSDGGLSPSISAFSRHHCRWHFSKCPWRCWPGFVLSGCCARDNSIAPFLERINGSTQTRPSNETERGWRAR